MMPKLYLFLIPVLSVLLPSYADASECPLLNGAYRLTIPKDGYDFIYTITMETRVENGVYNYTIDDGGDFLPADSKPRIIKVKNRVGKVAHACIKGSFLQVFQEDGTKIITRIKITPISESEWDVQSNLEDRSGIYYKL